MTEDQEHKRSTGPAQLRSGRNSQRPLTRKKSPLGMQPDRSGSSAVSLEVVSITRRYLTPLSIAVRAVMELESHRRGAVVIQAEQATGSMNLHNITPIPRLIPSGGPTETLGL